MCNRTRLILLGLATGVLCVGCGADSSGYPEDFGAGGSDVASGGSSVKTVSESSSGSNGGSQSSYATECQAVEAKACVPGASVSCACPDGSTSSQVCAADGQSFGACQCEVEPVEVTPDGYSGECLVVGINDTLTGCYSPAIALVNCPGDVAGGFVPDGYKSCFLPRMTSGTLYGVPGAMCCSK